MTTVHVDLEENPHQFICVILVQRLDEQLVQPWDQRDKQQFFHPFGQWSNLVKTIGTSIFQKQNDFPKLLKLKLS